MKLRERSDFGREDMDGAVVFEEKLFLVLELFGCVWLCLDGVVVGGELGVIEGDKEEEKEEGREGGMLLFFCFLWHDNFDKF